MEELIAYTTTLLEEIDHCHNRFITGEKPNKERAFFLEMKKESEPVFATLDKWVERSEELVKQRKITVLHPQQIDATKENMESLVLHSYYKDTRKRRFMEIYKSCYYIFAQLLKELTT